MTVRFGGRSNNGTTKAMEQERGRMNERTNAAKKRLNGVKTWNGGRLLCSLKVPKATKDW